MFRVERWAEAKPPVAKELRRTMEAEGYQVYEWSDPVGTSYPVHSHSTDQSHWILFGSIAFRLGEEEYVLGPGDRDFLPANTPHSARVVGNEAVVYLVGERSLR